MSEQLWPCRNCGAMMDENTGYCVDCGRRIAQGIFHIAEEGPITTEPTCNLMESNIWQHGNIQEK